MRAFLFLIKSNNSFPGTNAMGTQTDFMMHHCTNSISNTRTIHMKVPNSITPCMLKIDFMLTYATNNFVKYSFI